MQVFAGCGKRWLLLVVVLGLLLLPSTGCRAHGLISCGSQALECGLKPRSCNYWALSWENPLEKGMTTHSSILAWRIPWTEEPGRLQSMRSQRVGHNWATNTSTAVGLVVPQHVGSSQTRDPTCVSCIGRQSLALSNQGRPLCFFFKDWLFSLWCNWHVTLY